MHVSHNKTIKGCATKGKSEIHYRGVHRDDIYELIASYLIKCPL